MAHHYHFNRRGVLIGGAAALAAPAGLAQSPVSVWAAASLKGALDEIAPEATLVYGGSGALARQIAQGAPADIVILAATDWMDWLREQGAVKRAYAVARNSLVLAGPDGAGPIELSSEGIAAALGTGRLAMGEPMSVPAGRYAQQAFETLGLWAEIEPRALMAENVRAALAFVARGDVPLGAVYRSDVQLPGVVERAAFPETSHAPIVYPAALTSNASRAADMLLSRIAASGEIFARHGFSAA